MFASIGPGFVQPVASPGPLTTPLPLAPALAIATPQPRLSTPTVVHLEDTVAAGPVVSTARKGKKRARIDSTSPSPASAPRAQNSTAPPPALASDVRLPPALRPPIFDPMGWATPETSRGRLAPAAATAIEEALRTIPNGHLLAPGGRSAPTRERSTRATPVASSSRMRARDENAPFPGAPLGMDIDLQLDFVSPAARVPYGIPLQSLDLNRVRFPNAFPHMGPLPENSELADDQEDVLGMSNYYDHRPQGVLSVRDRPPTPHPLRALSSGSATPARVVSHSAAALAASFAVNAHPVPIPGVAQAQTANATTYRPVPGQLNHGTIGGHLFTDLPEGGFPPIHRADPDGLFTGLTQARGVALREENAIIVTVHNLGFPPRQQVRPATRAIMSVIRQITGELNPLIVPPERDWSAANPRQVDPPAFGVIGLTVEGALRVLARSTWSAPLITIHVASAAVAVTRFMFVISDFSHDHNGSILKSVFAVFSGPAVLPHILHHVQSHPNYADVHESVAASAILASLEVRVSTLDGGALSAAVFCDPPTMVPSRWAAWRARVASLPFNHPLNSTGVVRRLPPCEACGGEDHPTNQCPFQDVPGWNAPAPGTQWSQPGYEAPPDVAPTNAAPPPPPTVAHSAPRHRAHSARRGMGPNASAGHRRDQQGAGHGSSNGAGPSRGGNGYGSGRGGAVGF